MKRPFELDNAPDRRKFTKSDEIKTELRYRVVDGSSLVEDNADFSTEIPGFIEDAVIPFQRGSIRRTGILETEDGVARVDILTKKAGPIGRIAAKLAGVYPNKVLVTQFREKFSEEQLELRRQIHG